MKNIIVKHSKAKIDLFNYFKLLNNVGGPNKEDYSKLNAALNKLEQLINNHQVSESEMESLLEQCDFLKTTNSLPGLVKVKPFGYAGDYQTIDALYTCSYPINKYKKWNEYAYALSASVAVRNRKKYFKQIVSDKLSKPLSELKLCNVACGPARDLKEMYDLLENPVALKTTCIEYDKRAINYAVQLTHEYNRNIEFVHENIFKHQSKEKFDLVWSAGLFDYFDDKVFVRILERMTNWVKEGGEIIIGNFNDEHNPNRVFMERFVDWHLNHRSPSQLRHLAILAGIEPHQISVDKEEEGINLFLRIQF